MPMKNIAILIYLLFYGEALLRSAARHIDANKPFWYVMSVDGVQILAAIGIIIYLLHINTEFVRFCWKAITPMLAISYLIEIATVTSDGHMPVGKMIGIILYFPLVAIPCLLINYKNGWPAK
jgi:hypothetical protein